MAGYIIMMAIGNNIYMSNNILSIQKKFVILHRLSTDRKTERKRVFSIPLEGELGHFTEA